MQHRMAHVRLIVFVASLRLQSRGRVVTDSRERVKARERNGVGGEREKWSGVGERDRTLLACARVNYVLFGLNEDAEEYRDRR